MGGVKDVKRGNIRRGGPPKRGEERKPEKNENNSENRRERDRE